VHESTTPLRQIRRIKPNNFIKPIPFGQYVFIRDIFGDIRGMLTGRIRKFAKRIEPATKSFSAFSSPVSVRKCS